MILNKSANLNKIFLPEAGNFQVAAIIIRKT